MSIQTELELLQNTKDDNRSAIMEKGVTVYSDDAYSVYPARISQISMTPGDQDNLFKSLIDRSITSFAIPQGVTKIRTHSLYNCTSLTDVTIPDSVTVIQSYAFQGCTSLTGITCLAETPPIIGTSVFLQTNNCPIYVPEESVQAYKTAWSAYSSRIQAMPDDTLFNSIVDRSVTEIEIPNDVTTIGQYAFYGCTSLTTVSIPSSVTSIQYGAFEYCTSLTSLTVNRTTPPTLVNGSIPNNSSLVIYVPSSAVSAYQSASVWSQYSSKIQAIPS